MNKKLLLSATFSILFAAFVSGQTPLSTKPDIGKLNWLSGCWQNQKGERRRVEMWSKFEGNSMLGIGHLTAGGKTLEYEFMRIHLEADGIYYTAKPSGQAEDSFKLISLDDKEVKFENPQHDFPQRVIYRKQNDGSLVARIEGERNGKQAGIDFPFQRIKCE